MGNLTTANEENIFYGLKPFGRGHFSSPSLASSHLERIVTNPASLTTHPCVSNGKFLCLALFVNLIAVLSLLYSVFTISIIIAFLSIFPKEQLLGNLFSLGLQRTKAKYFTKLSSLCIMDVGVRNQHLPETKSPMCKGNDLLGN